jgi:hypothetical protein
MSELEDKIPTLTDAQPNAIGVARREVGDSVARRRVDSPWCPGRHHKWWAFSNLRDNLDRLWEVWECRKCGRLKLVEPRVRP